jgi:hypothetical protein
MAWHGGVARSDPLRCRPDGQGLHDAAADRGGPARFSRRTRCCAAKHSRAGDRSASFTAIRIGSGAIALSLLVALARTSRGAPRAGWAGAFALFAYAILFSLAYCTCIAGTGALILFGAVQMTMLAAALARGGGLAVLPQWCGWALALLGLYGLSWRRSATAEPLAALSMAAAGRRLGRLHAARRGSKAPLAATSGNFRRAVAARDASRSRSRGRGRACTRRPRHRPGLRLRCPDLGRGLRLWYAALRGLRTTQAAFLQLLVPVLAALLAVPLLGEPVTLALCLWGSLILAAWRSRLRRV